MTDAIKGDIQPKIFSFEWKIRRFFAGCQKVGDYYDSTDIPIQFPNKLTMWFLRVFPRGYGEESKDYISLLLYFPLKNEIKVTVDFQTSIVCRQNSLTTQKINALIFGATSTNWGWFTLIKQNVIKDAMNNAMVGDTLTILCEITLYPIVEEVTKSFLGYNEWLDKIGNGFGDYEQLLDSDRFTDVTFNVKGKQIDSHKAILSCRSPVFRAMFEHEMTENKQKSVDITDIDHDVMKELFRFIYSGKVKNIEEIAGDLLIAADKYQVNELKALCEKTLYDKLTVDNAVGYLKLTEMCDTIHLKRLVVQFVATNHKQVIEKPDFADLHKNLMYDILQAIGKNVS